MTPEEIAELKAGAPTIPKRRPGRPRKNPLPVDSDAGEEAPPTPKKETKGDPNKPGEEAELFGAMVATAYAKLIEVSGEVLEVKVTPLSDVETKRIERMTARVLQKHYGDAMPVEVLCAMSFAAPLLPRAPQLVEGLKKRKQGKQPPKPEPLKPAAQEGAQVIDGSFRVVQ